MCKCDCARAMCRKMCVQQVSVCTCLRPEGPRVWQQDNAGAVRQQLGLAPQAPRVQEQTAQAQRVQGKAAQALRVQPQELMKPAVTVQEHIAQALRVQEHAEQTLRVSMAFTEAEATGRSTEMNTNKGSQRLDTQIRDEMNRTAEPMNFQVSTHKVSNNTGKKIVELEGVIAALRTERSSSAYEGETLREAVQRVGEQKQEGGLQDDCMESSASRCDGVGGGSCALVLDSIAEWRGDIDDA